MIHLAFCIYEFSNLLSVCHVPDTELGVVLFSTPRTPLPNTEARYLTTVRSFKIQMGNYPGKIWLQIFHLQHVTEPYIEQGSLTMRRQPLKARAG